jgi:hypothetical protein
MLLPVLFHILFILLPSCLSLILEDAFSAIIQLLPLFTEDFGEFGKARALINAYPYLGSSPKSQVCVPSETSYSSQGVSWVDPDLAMAS